MRYKKTNVGSREGFHTAINFPLFSGLLATWIAAAVAAPEEIPTCNSQY